MDKCELNIIKPKLRILIFIKIKYIYSLNHYATSAVQKGYVDFMEGFFHHITATDPSPLDFFSWKCYAESPEEVSLHANYARTYLAQYGLRKTQSVISEFNRVSTVTGAYLDRKYPSELARAMIIAQKMVLICSAEWVSSALNATRTNSNNP